MKINVCGQWTITFEIANMNSALYEVQLLYWNVTSHSAMELILSWQFRIATSQILSSNHCYLDKFKPGFIRMNRMRGTKLKNNSLRSNEEASENAINTDNIYVKYVLIKRQQWIWVSNRFFLDLFQQRL